MAVNAAAESSAACSLLASSIFMAAVIREFGVSAAALNTRRRIARLMRLERWKGGRVERIGNKRTDRTSNL